YLHTDHLATPRKATNEAGQAVWQWESEAFGNALPQSSGIAVNLRFPGQYYDEETGLYYNYFRYYDPSTGRYVTSDPIGLRGGLNTYAYVGGNPVGWVDHYGLSPCDDEDEDCFKDCLKDNYGDLYDQLEALDPVSLISLALHEFSTSASENLRRQGTRNLDTGNFSTGQRQMRMFTQFSRFSAASAVAGAGAFGFRRGAEAYCALQCL
ncbi:MAG: hypothetical protein GY814_06065, partial [Gammaproteobacteria bacterium]|nr:hypothetical protein [Gammaproteobacteria bacterium]